MVILSKGFKPTEAQWNLLNRGLTFIPTIDIYKNQKQLMELDLQNYHRRLKLAAYFKNKSKQKPPPFTPKSAWIPPFNKIPAEISKLIEKDKKDFKQHYRIFKERHNLAMTEVKALRELMHNKSIIIKQADKGSAVVILDRDQYVQEACRQLNDEKYYKKLDSPIYPQTIPIMHRILDTLYMDKYINKRQRQYLKGAEQPRERRFYILPKIHKEPEKWNPPFEIPPGRPIVSDCNSETYQTAEYIDYFLNPLSTKHSSYVKDTYHFIDIIKSITVPHDSTFFTIDIDSLYTNIDTKSGLAAVKKIFKKYPDLKRPDQQVLELLEINLTRNDFVFDSKYYLQIKGTAMGKRFAPAYANIFMANWEEGALSKCPKKPLHYLRYLDDIWGIWQHSREELEQFIHILNNHDPSIKLKYIAQENSIDFLDTTVYKGPLFLENNKLDIKVYFKKTDTHALLYRTSFHPRHTFRGLIKSQLLRFDRICTQRQDFWEAVKILFGTLRQRGYSRSFLRHCLRGFRSPREQNNKEIIPFITTFSSVASKLNYTIKYNFESLIGSQDILPNHRIISAYRKNKNLGDFLVRAKLRPLQKLSSRSKLSYFRNLKYVRNRKDNTLHFIPQKFDPKSSNCIYLIYCSKCGKQYIGETRNSIATRMWQHKYNILHGKELDSPLVQHFLLHGWMAVRVAGVQGNFSWTDRERKKNERRWIFLLSTVEPFGLNRKYSVRFDT